MRHEIRLWWRGFSRSKQNQAFGWRSALIVALVLLALHGFVLVFALGFSVEPIRLDAPTLANLTMATGLLLAWMISQALNLITQALYSRGDVELLMSAPISMRRVLSVRALAIALPVIFSWGFVILPLCDLLAWFDSAHWLLAYPLMVALGLFATGLGLLLTMALFALLGPRRTRILGQVLSVLIGACGFLAYQARAVFPDSWVDGLAASLAGMARNGQFGLASLPVRALFGDMLALGVLLALGIGVFGVAVWVFGGSYAARVAAIAGSSEKAKPILQQARAARFRGGVDRSLILKEWRLLFRDPWLIGQVLLQLIYIVPMGFAFWKGSALPGTPVAGAAPMMAMLAGQLAGGLAWLTLSGEDAPDLVASAPVGRARVMRAKIVAGLLPVLIVMAVPLLLLWTQSLFVGALTSAACLGAALSATLTCLWTQKPRPRKTFGYRQRGSILSNLAETALNFCWFFLLAALIWRSAWAALPVGIGAVLMLVLYKTRKAQALL